MSKRRTFEARIASAFAMSDATWERHANPWSVWTRFAALPALAAAAWSRQLPWIALAVLGTWWNPRAFPKPASTDNWASKAVLGERVWLQRDQTPIPARHATVPHLLNAVAGAGVPLVILGMGRKKLALLVAGMALVYLGKLLFLHRMVLLYDDMKDANQTCRSWLY